jgi:hypothetical protein
MGKILGNSDEGYSLYSFLCGERAGPATLMPRPGLLARAVLQSARPRARGARR